MNVNVATIIYLETTRHSCCASELDWMPKANDGGRHMRSMALVNQHLKPMSTRSNVNAIQCHQRDHLSSFVNPPYQPVTRNMKQTSTHSIKSKTEQTVFLCWSACTLSQHPNSRETGCSNVLGESQPVLIKEGRKRSSKRKKNGKSRACQCFLLSESLFCVLLALSCTADHLSSTLPFVTSFS